MPEFSREMMCEAPKVTPSVRLARALWVCYYVLTEIYDQAVEARFDNVQARRLMEKNALGVKSRVIDVAAHFNVPPEVLIAERDTVADVTQLDQKLLQQWMDQEGWHKTVMPLLREGRRPIEPDRRPRYGS
jgi:hypothetical protein